MRSSTAWCCALLLVPCSIAPAAQQKARASQKDVSRELQRLYDEDHADQASWSADKEAELGRRQDERAKRVREILTTGMLATPADWSNAAWLLQHGDGAEDYALAHALSGPPLIQDATANGFACAATLDRFLESIRRTEIFSTQNDNGQPYAAQPFGAYATMPDSIRRVFALAPVAKDAAKPEKGAAKELPKLVKLAQEATGPAGKDAPAWLVRTREIVGSGALDSDKDYLAAAQILL